MQVDETLVGGKGSANNELVLVAAEADARVRLAHAENNDEGTLKSFADSQTLKRWSGKCATNSEHRMLPCSSTMFHNG